jgi:hypothetical protein
MPEQEVEPPVERIKEQAHQAARAESAAAPVRRYRAVSVPDAADAGCGGIWYFNFPGQNHAFLCDRSPDYDSCPDDQLPIFCLIDELGKLARV